MTLLFALGLGAFFLPSLGIDWFDLAELRLKKARVLLLYCNMTSFYVNARNGGRKSSCKARVLVDLSGKPRTPPLGWIFNALAVAAQQRKAYRCGYRPDERAASFG
ncbi:hypothetical protein ACHMW7_02400 (plasmid) [Aminobacter sp. UC22_36]|uniref:hypothetical protein n=1 Tax=Aminobacter sp. UC22_36 TaxID=3374549 RepID=UPI00375840AA